MEHEPVRLSGWAALAVGLVLLAVIGLSMGAPLPAVIGQAASVALASIGGLEFARQKVTPTRHPSLPPEQAPDGDVQDGLF